MPTSQVYFYNYFSKKSSTLKTQYFLIMMNKNDEIRDVSEPVINKWSIKYVAKLRNTAKFSHERHKHILEALKRY